MSSGIYIEKKLINMLERFDNNTYNDYLDALHNFTIDIQKTGMKKPITWIRKYDYDQPIAFRVNINQPIFLMLSHPISQFRRADKYWVTNDEQKLCVDHALVPVFCVSLNRYTVLRLWGDEARRFLSPTAEPITDEKVFWQLPSAKKGTQYSSMNFILRRESRLGFAPKQINDYLRNYFNYFYWSFPHKGFACCAHMINDDTNIRTMLKITKSIFCLDGIYEDKLLIGPEEMEVVRCVLKGLRLDGDNIRLFTFTPILTANISTDLQEYVERNFFLNGIVSEFRRRGPTRFNTLNVVAEYGVNQIELLEAIIGMVAIKYFVEKNSLSYIGTINDIEKKTNQILNYLRRKRIVIDRTIANGIEEPFTYTLDLMFPNLIAHNDDLLFCHPFLLSSLNQYGLLDRIVQKTNPMRLINVLRLLDMIPQHSRTTIMRTKEMKDLENERIFKEHIFSALIESVQGIFLSKLLQKHFTESDRDRLETDEDEPEEFDIDGIDELDEEKEYTNVCLNCSGTGIVLDTKYVRQERVVVPVTYKKTCPICKGKGILVKEL